MKTYQINFLLNHHDHIVQVRAAEIVQQDSGFIFFYDLDDKVLYIANPKFVISIELIEADVNAEVQN